MLYGRRKKWGRKPAQMVPVMGECPACKGNGFVRAHVPHRTRRTGFKAVPGGMYWYSMAPAGEECECPVCEGDGEIPVGRELRRD